MFNLFDKACVGTISIKDLEDISKALGCRKGEGKFKLLRNWYSFWTDGDNKCKSQWSYKLWLIQSSDEYYRG